jgi:hypothetical protein
MWDDRKDGHGRSGPWLGKESESALTLKFQVSKTVRKIFCCL